MQSLSIGKCSEETSKIQIDFFTCFITMDETWIHHYIPETNEQWEQWTFSGESAPKQAKTSPSTGKVMATIFWDSQDVILTDYL
ncbi:hypothetical protein Trydic_g16408 [Trypoxylus dichotomus]